MSIVIHLSLCSIETSHTDQWISTEGRYTQGQLCVLYYLPCNTAMNNIIGTLDKDEQKKRLYRINNTSTELYCMLICLGNDFILIQLTPYFV
jgi:hypothetical protein